MPLTRRDLLSALAAGAALGPSAVLAEAPERSLRPRLRVSDTARTTAPSGRTLIDKAGLGGLVSYAVADASGRVIEAHEPARPMPPASTAKALTALYALHALGPDHRFETRLMATGPVEDGVVKGDLVLAGGGDPVLDSDVLDDMAAALAARGVTRVDGALRTWTGALPYVREIDPEQPDHVGYNPAIAGLNLNYNRVHFGWARQGTGYDVTMDARGVRASPPVRVARMEVIDRRMPVYTYSGGTTRDDWTVARGALGSEGGRWLPVRHPGLYAGEALAGILHARGISCRGPIGVAETAEGEALVRHLSEPVAPLLRGMLKHSTNLTAEVMGLAASQALGADVPDLHASAARMNGWLAERYGMEGVALEDHSGLGDDSRVSASDMVRAMVASGPDGRLAGLMKPFNSGDDVVRVAAKTGTLNFVSALTGYVRAPGAGPFAFAIFCADTDRRDALPMEQRERPAGGRRWANAARGLQRALLQRWSVVHAA